VPPETPRPRNATATRNAILAAAVDKFAEAGYDGVGVREIAGAAGVTAMLVNRYFGSKEQLFVEAVETSFAPATYVADDATDLATTTAAALVGRTAEQTEGMAPFLIMLRSSSNARATEIVRDAIERHVGKRLTRHLTGPGRAVRADVLLSVISGVLLMRQVVGTRALNAPSSDQLQDVLEVVFDAIVGTQPA